MVGTPLQWLMKICLDTLWYLESPFLLLGNRISVSMCIFQESSFTLHVYIISLKNSMLVHLKWHFVLLRLSFRFSQCHLLVPPWKVVLQTCTCQSDMEMGLDVKMFCPVSHYNILNWHLLVLGIMQSFGNTSLRVLVWLVPYGFGTGTKLLHHSAVLLTPRGTIVVL